MMSPPFGWSEREATNPYFFCHFCTLVLEYQVEFDLKDVGTALFAISLEATKGADGSLTAEQCWLLVFQSHASVSE